MLVGGNAVLRNAPKVPRGMGVRDKGDRRRKGRAVRATVVAMKWAEIKKQPDPPKRLLY